MAVMLEDKALRQFISEYLTSFVTWDLFDLYASTPTAEGKAADVAYLIGRDTDQVASALRELAAEGFVRASGPEDDPVYTYDPPDELAELVKRFSEATAERDFRLTALVELLARSSV